MLPLILASQSPRRRELLAQAGILAIVRPADIDESAREGEGATEMALRLATEKAEAVQREDGQKVLAADTLVVLGIEVLGKPRNRLEAFDMIRKLSGRTHVVTTAFAIRGVERSVAQAVHTKVTFRQLTDTEIETYLDLEDYLDKAGAYGIQSAGGALTDQVMGSYTNVVGLPLEEVLVALHRDID